MIVAAEISVMCWIGSTRKGQEAIDAIDDEGTKKKEGEAEEKAVTKNERLRRDSMQHIT